MPGTTMGTSTRASRSRFSSPQVNNQSPNETAEQQSKGPATGLDNQKAFMARWLEPPVAVKPSYQDAGLMRHGVVEGMAPLGTLPKIGIFKKVAAPTASEGTTPPQSTPPMTRIVLKPRVNTATTPKQPVAARPLTPAAQTEDDTEELDESEDEEEEEEGMIAPPPRPSSRRRSLLTEDDDADWAPAAKAVSVGASLNTRTRRSMSRASAGRPGSVSLTSPSMQQTSANSVSRVMDNLKVHAYHVVESAVNEALEHFRYPTAWALRKLYEENSGDREFILMVLGVFKQTADAETVEEFNRLINRKKKDGRKGNKGFLYFVSPSTSTAPAPNEPKRAPYHSMLKREAPETGASGEQTTSERAEENEQVAEQVQQQEQPQSQAPESFQQEKRKRLPEEPQPRMDETPSKRQCRKSSSKPSKSATPAPAPAPTIKSTTTPKVMASNGKKSRTGSTPATANGRARLTESPSMRRKARAVSIASSTSSLSSARSLTPPDGIMDSDGEVDVSDVPPSPTSPSPAGETSNNANAQPSAPQPIARPKRNNAPKKKRNVSRTTTPAASSPALASTTYHNNNTTTTRHQHQTAAASSMPALIEPPIFPNLPPPTKSAYKAAGALHDKGVPFFPSRVGKLDDNDERIRLRQKAKNVTNGVALPESFSRYELHEQEKQASTLRSALEEAAVAGSNAARPQPRSSRVSGAVFTETANGYLNAAARSTRSSRKRSHDEIEEDVSPITAHFPPGALEGTSTAPNSRAQTPVLRPAKKARTGARVKQSPMKKKSGTSAGIPRPSGERSSPAAIGTVQDENDDYCSSCGGNGELLCCDGCTRAFHLNCVDPPLFEDSMPADWFCNVCIKQRSGFGRHSGAFKALLESLDPKNSSAFRLPAVIREYFEGVRTGVDGEYEEIVAVQKASRKKKVEEEVPDFYRLRDNDGNPIICHLCDKPTADNRPIIPCNVCGLWWHIDCLDPPLAQPPVLRTWRCPAHVDDLLAKIPGVRGPAHRFRKVKGAPDITPAYSRGNVNNGFIEVINDDESDDESGYKDRTTFGRLQHLSAKGVEADFMYKVRKNRKGKPIPPLAATIPRLEAPQAVDPCAVEKQQAALNLVQLSGKGKAGVDTLVDTLLANADPAVISLMARANTQHLGDIANLNKFDEQSLRAMLAQMQVMQAQIKDMLMHGADIPSPATPLSAARVPDDYRGQSAPRQPPFAALIAKLDDDDLMPGAASDSAEVKELPSPPATENQPDERAQDVIAVATDSPAADIKTEGGVD